MKPTKNRVFCKDCRRTKMLFETEKKANNFIAFNQEEIRRESGFAPKRSYFCRFCGGWHTTSIKGKIGLSENEELREKYLKEKSEKIVPDETKVSREEKRNEIMIELENQIKTMDTNQMKMFFSEKINLLKKEIDDLIGTTNNVEKGKLKETRQNLEIVYIVRKKNGLQKKKKHYDKLSERELEEWRLLIEKRVYDKE